jgi:hypothetical protein
MGDSVKFGLSALHSEVAAARTRHDAVRAGIGSRFLPVFRAEFDQIENEFHTLKEQVENNDPKAMPGSERSVARLLTRLRDLDKMVTEYAADVGRDDLPLGYVMLIDKVSKDVLGAAGDPLVHVSDAWDYSTTPLGSGMILHLPAVDPANALLAPILVHEVAHALFRHANDELNQLLSESVKPLSLITASLPALDDDDETKRREMLPKWAEELFCDAIATLVAGPAYLLALSSRTVGSEWNSQSGHPPPHLRIRLVYEILKAQGWKPYIRHHAADIDAWAEEFAGRKAQNAPTSVRFLIEAAELLFVGIITIAGTKIVNPLRPASSVKNAYEAARHFRHKVLPVDLPRTPAIEWEFVLGAWLLALEVEGGGAEAIPKGPFSSQLNGLLIKTVELSKIADLWSNDDAVG